MSEPMFIGFDPWVDFGLSEVESVPTPITPLEMVGIAKIIQESTYKNFYLGTAIDYNGVEYDFEWDYKNNRLAKLKGTDSSLIWTLVSEAISPLTRPPTKPVQKPELLPPHVESPTKEYVDTQNYGMGTVPKTLADLYSQTLDVKPNGEIEVDISDDEIAERAAKVLQET